MENFSLKCVSLEIYEWIKTKCQNDNTCGTLVLSIVMVFQLEWYLIFQKFI